MCDSSINRREFVSLSTTGVAGAVLASGHWLCGAEQSDDWNPDRPPVVTGRKLVVQPVLMHTTYSRKEAASWRSWGKINTPEAAAEERQRIGKELAALAGSVGFPLELRPLVTITSVAEARKLHGIDYDAILLYPATGSANMLRGCFPTDKSKDVLIFARHESGPTYYWYEAIGTRVLAKGTPEELAQNTADNHGPPSVHDVVIDDYGELRWRLRALYALKNFIGQRIVALGGAGGKYDGQAPEVARKRYQLNIIDVTYEELAARLKQCRADAALTAKAEKWTDRYLALPGTTMETKRQFVVKAFLLYAIFKAWMREHQAPAFTIQSCMGTVIPMSQTTACMPLSWLNDEGLLAFCESDFVIIPPGIFLHYVVGKPVFLHNSTFPHRAMVTCAHCTAPRRMDGKKYELARIMTHYESDYGAAPKVNMPVGQEVTFIDPEFSSGRWVGIKGIIKANPFHEICRTQQDVEIQGDWKRLLAEARDSHWMMAYGNHLETIAYAAGKIGLNWVDISTG